MTENNNGAFTTNHVVNFDIFDIADAMFKRLGEFNRVKRLSA